MRNRLVWSAIGIPCIIGLVGAVTEDTYAKTRLRLVIRSAFGQPVFDFLSDRLEQFRKTTGITTVMTIQPGDAREYVPLWGAAGSLPDIIDVNPVTSFCYVNLLADLGTLIKSDKSVSMNTFIPGAWKAFQLPEGPKWKGRIYGLPTSTFTTVFAYNRDLLSKAGLQYPSLIGDKWTWDTMLSYAKKLTKDVTGDGNPDVYGLGIPNTIFRYGSFIHQAGTPWANAAFDPTEFQLNTPDAHTALKFLTDMMLVHRVVQFGAFSENFVQKRVAMTWDGTPTLIRWPKTAPFYDFVTYPMGPKNNGTEYTLLGWGITQSSKLKKEAWQLLKFLCADAESVRRYTSATGLPPALKSLSNQYVSLLGAGAPKSASYFSTICESPDNYLRPMPRTQLAIPAVEQWINKAFIGRISVDSALAGADKDANGKLAVSFRKE